MKEEGLVKNIAGIVLQKLLLQQQNRLLVVFCGTNKASDFVLHTVKQIRSSGVQYDLLVSRTAYEHYDLDELKGKCEPDKLWLDQIPEDSQAFLMNYDTVVAADPDIPAAARIAGCMPQGCAESIILQALLCGKGVFFVKDECCPDCLGQRPGFRIPDALAEKLRGNLLSIREYGSRVVRSDELKTALTGRLHLNPGPGSVPETSKEDLKETAGDAGSGSLVFPGKILSCREIRKYPGGSNLKIRSGTMVTQMAEDLARKNAITIQITN